MTNRLESKPESNSTDNIRQLIHPVSRLSPSNRSKQDSNPILTPMELKNPNPHPFQTHLVSNADSPEFSLLQWALRRSSVVALDAEWKPTRSGSGSGSTSEVKPASAPSFPTVTLLQIACRVLRVPSDPICGDSPVFVVDLISIPLSSIWEILRDMFVSASILKLGFRFKQDLVYLSSTFESQGGFDKVEPFLDITSIYHHLRNPKAGKKFLKESKSLATICEEMLNISLSKELQCSDWSCRPLTEEQISYAAADAYYLLEIFAVFECNFDTEGKMPSYLTEINSSSATIGLREILLPAGLNICHNVLTSKFCKASDMVRSSASKTDVCTMIASNSWILHRNTSPMDKRILDIVRNYGERLQLKETDRKPRAPRRKGRRQSANANCREKLECNGVWQGLPPWDPSLGGDGCPKFLCDVMVEGLARHLRCVGIDAAIPSLKKPETRQLLDQAYKEKRVVLTRDIKLLQHQYLIRNQVYRVKNLLKNDQLLEVIETFQLKISENQLMSRCTKCNGSFIQKPLTMEEAIEASKGFQVIPNCLFNRNIEFWQCTDCHQLYWEGTQYHNAVQKFVTVCKLNDLRASSPPNI